MTAPASSCATACPTDAAPGWTGGQYSMFRAFLGAYLAVHFAMLLPWGAEIFSSSGMLAAGRGSPLLLPFHLFAWADSAAFVVGALAAGAAASIALAVGWHDRIAAAILALLWASCVGRNPLISNPGIPYVGWMLVAHTIVPPAPFGSVAARGRVDPGGGWTMPRTLWIGAWALMAAGYSYSGVTKLASPSWRDGSALAAVLENPLARPTFLRDAALALPDWLLRSATWGALALEIAVVPLAFVSRARPFLWTALLAMHLGLMVLVDFADLSLGMVALHAFTFDPRWLAPRGDPASPSIVFYDGSCGLCHRTVRFLLAEDSLAMFRMAPLQGETIAARIAADERARLPDSVVLLSPDGRTWVRSDAVIRMFEGLGGAWRAIAAVLRCVPRGGRDRAYDAVARVRLSLFAKPGDACPILPPHLRGRILP